MNVSSVPRRSTTATALFGLLDPIPYGCFVAALIFDIAYLRSAQILWTKGAAWLITFGLLFAVIPRVINLVQVWITRRRSPWPASYAGFWLNLVAIVLAIINAFVHSRDAYAVVPAGMWLSLATVLLLAIAHIAQALRQATAGGPRHE